MWSSQSIAATYTGRGCRCTCGAAWLVAVVMRVQDALSLTVYKLYNCYPLRATAHQAHYRDYGQMTYARALFVIHNIAHQGRGP